MNLKHCKDLRKMVKTFYGDLPKTSYSLSKDKKSIVLGNCQRKKYKELKKICKSK